MIKVFLNFLLNLQWFRIDLLLLAAVTPLNDALLLRRMKSGDQEAFGLLYRRYFSRLSNFAFRRLQDEAITEELVMDVFFELWQQRRGLDISINLSSWLHGVLRNKALHELRARITREKHLNAFALNQQSSVGAAVDDELDAQLLQERFKQAIERLSPQCRQAFKLSRYEHLTYNEIAIQMGISVKTVEKHIGKAIDLLRKDFKGYQLNVVVVVALLELAAGWHGAG